MKLTKEQSIQLDAILKYYIEQSRGNIGILFDPINLNRKFHLGRELALFYYQFVVDFPFNNLKIVDAIYSDDTFPRKSCYQINANTIDFLNSGGFTKIFEDQEQERLKQIIKEELELQNLSLVPKQFRFNKTSVWINAILTLITIVLTVLIALGIIDKLKN